MKDAQKKFHEFMMNRVDERDKKAMDQLLQQSFQKQDEGTMDSSYLMKTGGEMLKMVKEEFKDDVSAAMKEFKG